MRLGDTIATYDVALALRGESGKFEVTSPTGEIYHVICNPQQSITNLQSAGSASNPQPFLIRKVAEPVSRPPEKALSGQSETPAQSREGKAPFLITADDERCGSEGRNTSDGLPENVEPDLNTGDILRLGLCLESEATTQRPTAWVSVRRELQEGRGKVITNGCASFREFDAEVRRLQAQLDDIRYRARKKFYEAQVIAAGA